MSWSSRELALRAWVKASSGLGDEYVIWDLHKGNRPVGNPFISLRLGDLIPLTFVDEFRLVDDDGPTGDPLANPPRIGAELEYQIRGSRRCSLSIQAFAGNEVYGDSSARALLSKVQQGLSNPAIRAALRAAGIFPYDPGQIQDISGITATFFESRAVLNMLFYTTETTTASETYIETVTLTDTIADPDRDIDITIEV